jgi:hypothetical protein
MSLTIAQEAILKEVANKEIKQKATDTINTDAYKIINIKKDEIQVLEDKRISDIKKLG